MTSGIAHRTKTTRLAWLLCVLPFAVGCINDDIDLYEVQVHGQVTSPIAGSLGGTLQIEFHHQHSAGAGALAHPLGQIDRRTVSAPMLPAEVNETLLYPTQAGQGLVIYGWLDRDGDGVLCAPGQNSEPAGLVVIPDFPAHRLTISLLLSQPCVGPERLYP